MFTEILPYRGTEDAAEAASSASPASATPPAPHRSRASWAPYLYILPATALLVLWTYLPLAQTFQLSFYDWNLLPTQEKKPVGLDNYREALSLPELHQALGNTVWYILAFMLLTVALPVVFALLSKRVSGRAKTVYQALIFLPYLVTPVATAAIWRWMFDSDGGAVTAALGGLGIDVGNIFRDPGTAMIGIMVVVGWQLLGFGVLIVSAGLAGINPDYGHAADVDGATRRQTLWRITLPLLSPTLVFLALMTILLSAQWTFPAIDMITAGGPAGSSTNIYYLLYQFGFENFDSGLSAASGVLFFLAFGVVAWIFVELSDRLSFHDS